MLTYLVSSFFNNFINIELEIISMRMNFTFCQTVCGNRQGHLPFVFEDKELDHTMLATKFKNC